MKTLYHFQTAARIEAGPHSLNLLGDYLDQIGLNQIRSGVYFNSAVDRLSRLCRPN